jgi:hypothetical protein
MKLIVLISLLMAVLGAPMPPNTSLEIPGNLGIGRLQVAQNTFGDILTITSNNNMNLTTDFNQQIANVVISLLNGPLMSQEKPSDVNSSPDLSQLKTFIESIKSKVQI